MITRVRVKNFRSLADVDVTLGPLTVLVGRNGAGKSAFVDALRFVRDIMRYNLDVALEKRKGLTSIASRVPLNNKDEYSRNVDITLVYEQENTCIEYALSVGVDLTDRHVIQHERCRIGRETDQLVTVYESNNGMIVTTPDNWPFSSAGKTLDFTFKSEVSLKLLAAVLQEADRLLHHLTAADFYAVYPDALRIPQSESGAYALSESADNLASVLDRLLVGKFYRTLVDLMKLFVDDLEDIRVLEVGGYLVIQIKHTLKNGTGFWLDLAQESDGIIRVLSLLTMLYQDAGHKLIAIEEPELFLYPRTMAALAGVIAETSLTHQIIITTQSPDFISEFSADKLRIVERKEGLTHIGPLDEVQNSIIHDELFTTGDLLRIEGLHSLPTEPVSADVA